jgi:hypothetical protein
MAAKFSDLRLYGTHNLNKSGIHEYEFYITPAKGRELEMIGKKAFSVPISRFEGKARDALANEFERFKAQGASKKPAVRLGMITFQVTPTEKGNIAYAMNYKPKGEVSDIIQSESRGTGLGGQIEAWCLEHLRKAGKATHVATTEGAQKHFQETGGLEDETETLNSFATSAIRVAHLKKCGIGALEVLPIKEWAFKVARH